MLHLNFPQIIHQVEIFVTEPHIFESSSSAALWPDYMSTSRNFQLNTWLGKLIKMLMPLINVTMYFLVEVYEEVSSIGTPISMVDNTNGMQLQKDKAGNQMSIKAKCISIEMNGCNYVNEKYVSTLWI